MLGAAVAFQKGQHFALSTLSDRLPERMRRPLMVLVTLAVIALSLILIVEGSKVTQQTFSQRFTGIPLSRGWQYLAVPVGGGLMLLYALAQLVALLRPVVPWWRDRSSAGRAQVVRADADGQLAHPVTAPMTITELTEPE